MKKACLVVNPPYDQGEIFNADNMTLNRDGCLDFFVSLKREFLRNNVLLETHDRHSPEDCEWVLYNEMPSRKPQNRISERASVLLFESELIRPDNWDLSAHRQFRKIFTWHDGFVDGEHYCKFNFTHSGKTTFLPFEERTGFCTLIAGHKRISHKLELYSQRIEAIKWFERYHPDQFEFFGMGWDRYAFKRNLVGKVMSRCAPIVRALKPKWSSYGGSVVNKLEVLRNYKFSICYENAKDIPGYITEKIFDSLSAGCIPIYWGASNIEEYVPKSCFIDRRQFFDYNELYNFLDSMSEYEFNSRLRDIENYLDSSAHESFTPEFVARQVCTNILNA